MSVWIKASTKWINVMQCFRNKIKTFKPHEGWLWIKNDRRYFWCRPCLLCGGAYWEINSLWAGLLVVSFAKYTGTYTFLVKICIAQGNLFCQWEVWKFLGLLWGRGWKVKRCKKESSSCLEHITTTFLNLLRMMPIYSLHTAKESALSKETVTKLERLRSGSVTETSS